MTPLFLHPNFAQHPSSPSSTSTSFCSNFLRQRLRLKTPSRHFFCCNKINRKMATLENLVHAIQSFSHILKTTHTNKQVKRNKNKKDRKTKREKRRTRIMNRMYLDRQIHYHKHKVEEVTIPR